jgi:hypothetical protein
MAVSFAIGSERPDGVWRYRPRMSYEDRLRLAVGFVIISVVALADVVASIANKRLGISQ